VGAVGAAKSVIDVNFSQGGQLGRKDRVVVCVLRGKTRILKHKNKNPAPTI
jgi:hypothetical protein